MNDERLKNFGTVLTKIYQKMCQMKKNNNKIYYHYCSVDTFYNILQTGTIRFGNPLNMNDSAEIIWLLEMVKDFVLKRGGYNSTMPQMQINCAMTFAIVKVFPEPVTPSKVWN